MRPCDIVTPVEPCETGCGALVAVTVRRDDGARRLSEIDGDGRIVPGGHSADWCRERRRRQHQGGPRWEPCEVCTTPVLTTEGRDDGVMRPVMLDNAAGEAPTTFHEHTPQRCRDLRDGSPLCRCGRTRGEHPGAYCRQFRP